ncbi:hypothetical protein IPG36_06480 [bacterium]|nr:MAG: hypothetical protein IPG36_06480 [bacterium]
MTEAVDYMSKMYLDRLISSFSKDIQKFDESEARKYIEKNLKEIRDPEHIKKRVAFHSVTYQQRLLMRDILEFLLLQRKYECAEKDIEAAFAAFRKNKLRRYKSQDVLNAIPANKQEIMGTLYEVVYENDAISQDEEKVLSGLQHKLSLTDIEVWTILAAQYKIDKQLAYTPVQFAQALKDLQCHGLVLYLSKEVSPRKFMIPKDIALVLAEFKNYPLDQRSYTLLVGELSRATIGDAAKKFGLYSSGTKDEVINRLWCQGRAASDVLGAANRSELSAIAAKIPTIKSSSVKEALIADLNLYYFLLDTNPIAEVKAVTDAQLWEYYPEFGRRNYALLRKTKLIDKDLEIEHQFEKLTRYAFTKFARAKLLNFSAATTQTGSTHRRRKECTALGQQEPRAQLPNYAGTPQAIPTLRYEIQATGTFVSDYYW